MNFVSYVVTFICGLNHYITRFIIGNVNTNRFILNIMVILYFQIFQPTSNNNVIQFTISWAPFGIKNASGKSKGIA